MAVIDSDLDDPADQTKLDKFKRRVRDSRDAFRAQRDREEEDLAFQVPENQWDSGARSARAGGKVNGVVVNARPTLAISQIDQPVQLVKNQAQAAKLGANIHPVSEKANKETAEVLQGLYRRIERDSHADHARMWAFDRATKAGMGAYLVTTQWDDLSENGFDQEIVIKRVLYQSMVGFDPNAQEPDFSDGEYSWMGGLVTRETFKREWPDTKLADATDAELDDYYARDTDWYEGTGRDRKILVVTLWYKVHDFETLTTGEGKDKRTRKRDKITIRCAKITATDVLEDEETNGHLLPLIPTIGRELQPFKNDRRWVGMIGPAKDGQKLFNFAASSFVESMAAEPKNPWIVAEGQVEGREEIWQQSNVRNLAYLEYKPTSLNGQPVGPPQRTQVDTSRMQLSMMGMQESRQMIQATTMIHAPSLGILTGKEKSGRALLAAQGESDAATSNYLANLADISLAYEARVVLDLMPSIYDRPGRVCRILTGENKDKVVMLNKPYTEDQDGRPVAASEGAKDAKMYDLREANGYSISTTIGKSFQTRLQQGAEQIGELLQAAPALLPVIGDIYFGYQDIPGAPEIKKRMEKWREMQMPGLGEGDDGTKPSVEALQAQVQSMQQQGQMLSAQLQQAMSMIETERVKAEARYKEAELKAQADLMKQQAADQTKLRVAEINAGVKAGTVQQDQIGTEAEQAREHAFEANQNEKDRQHEDAMQRFDAAHEVALEATKAKLRPIPEPGGKGGRPNGGSAPR